MIKKFRPLISFIMILTMLFSINFSNIASAHTDNNVSSTDEIESTPQTAATSSKTAVEDPDKIVTSDKKVDLSFVIDSTGSMSDAIANVKNNITEFAQYLESKGLTLRIGIVEYRDITCDGMDSTVVHKYNYTTWHNNSNQMVETLGTIMANGGGDAPETLVDAMGYLVDGETMLWSSDAYKFAVVLTDVDYKIDNRFGYTSMNQVIDKLVSNNINTSVITDSRYYNDNYKTLTDRTGGIYGNIYSSDFSSVLEELANRVIGETMKKDKAIYVLPGYMGSKLYNDAGSEIWADPNALYNDVLAYSLPFGSTSLLTLNSDGTGSKVHVDMTKDKYGSQDAYKTLVTSLQSELGADYDVVFFPYNWLGDLNDSAQKLQDHINTSGYDSVTIITHSTGGLLASAYIAASRDNKLKVDKAILIAAPLFGTYTALEPIETGKTAALDSMLASSGIDNGLFGLKYKAIYSWVKAITKNSPTTYQLLPSIEYLKRMPSIYKSDFSGTAVITKNQYYSVLNASSNINKNLTNGNNRSHQYFRDVILKDDVVDLWQSEVVGTLQEVDTLLIGSSYGNLTPAIAVYANKLFGGTKLDNIIYKMEGDGTVLDVSAFATAKTGEHILNYKDYTGLSHGELANSSKVISDIINYIKGTEEASLRLLSSATEVAGMSNFVSLKVKSDEHVDIQIQDALGTTVASVKNIDEMLSYGGKSYPYSDILVSGFDGKNFIYLPFSTEYAGTDALIYMPSSGYKVVFNYGTEADAAVTFHCDLSALDRDGFKTAMAGYDAKITQLGGNILTLDMTVNKADASNVDTLCDSGSVVRKEYFTGWELEQNVVLHDLGETIDVGIVTVATGSSIVSVVTGGSIALNWTSSDNSVATVSELGNVTAIGYGTAVISATDGNKVSTCNVTVPLVATTVKIKDVSMQVGEKVLIKPIFTPSSVTESNLLYEYDTTAGIINIDGYGVITALKEGSIIVTASTVTGLKTTFTVSVSNSGIISVQSVSILPSDLSLSKGGTLILEASILPSNATNKGIAWYIEDESIASVGYSGLTCNVTGLKAGTTKLTVVTNDGGYTSSVNITVNETPTVTPTAVPTAVPTVAPTAVPTTVPTAAPTIAPTAVPTTVPTAAPTIAPTAVPTTVPTAAPTVAPTVAPTAVPTTVPTAAPTTAPTSTLPNTPTATPTLTPTPTPISPVDVVIIHADMNKVNKDFEGEVKVSTFKGKSILSIQVPTERILGFVKETGATPSKQVQLSLVLPESKLLNMLSNKEVQSVFVNVVASSDLIKNRAVKVNKLELFSTIFKAAKKNGKNVVVAVLDEKANVQYEWSFIGKSLQNSSSAITDVNLALDMVSAYNQVNTAIERDSKNAQGLIVRFHHNGKLPSQVSLKIYVGNQKYIKSGQNVYVYRYNKVTDKLETIKDGYNYKMDKNGFINLKVVDCSDYVILPKEASKYVTSSLLDQITILPKQKSMKLSGTTGVSMQLAISMPDSIQWVKSLSDNTVPSGIAALTITFKSSDPSVADVNKDGKIIAKGLGKATITVNLKLYSGKTKSIKILISVKK